MRIRLQKFSILIGVLTAIAGMGGSRVYAQSSNAPALFFDLAAPAQLSAGVRKTLEEDAKLKFNDPTVARRRLVRLDMKTLYSNVMDIDPAKLKGPEVRLNLFDGLNFHLVADQVRRVSDTLVRVQGHDAEVAQSSVSLVIRNDRITGNVWLRNRLVEIRPLANGLQSITEINPSGYGEELPPTAPDLVNPEKDDTERDIDPAAKPVIDVAVFYTPEAEAASGDILSEIDLAIDVTNKSYENSHIRQRLRLAHAERIAYNESGDLKRDRDRLQNLGDGFMDGVHARRDAMKADLVSLWVERGDGCGIAYIMETVTPSFEPYGFSVTKRNCASSNLTFGHELGHNMGARHDYYVDPTIGRPYEHNHGYANAGRQWRTVMSYNNVCGSTRPCMRIPYWSNPDNTYSGEPMGTRGPGPWTDNRLTLDKTAHVVEGFR